MTITLKISKEEVQRLIAEHFKKEGYDISPEMILPEVYGEDDELVGFNVFISDLKKFQTKKP